MQHERAREPTVFVIAFELRGGRRGSCQFPLCKHLCVYVTQHHWDRRHSRVHQKLDE